METTFDKNIDRERVKYAVKHFIENGGKIKLLSPQKSTANTMIYRPDLAAYESIHDFLM